MWTIKRPTEIGKYWCYQNNHSRIISIWKYSSEDTNLFTNEDGGCSLKDVYYDNVLWWSKKIEPPEKPKEENKFKQNVTDTWR